MTVSEMVVVTESPVKVAEMLVVADTVVLAVVVAVIIGPVTVTVSEMVVVTEFPVKMDVSEMFVVRKRVCLRSWWLLL